jgi:AsmA protein
MRTGRVLALLVGGLVALLGVGLLTVWLLVNPDDYKPQIIAAVHHATGRDLILDGRLKLSLFPWIALKFGAASLSNPPGFPAQPFLSFASGSARLRLIPLLAKHLEFGQIDIDGLDVRLVRNAAGFGNWQPVGRGVQDSPRVAGDAGPSSATGAPVPQPALPDLAAIKITHARVSYQDITIDHLNLETGAFAERGQVPVTLSAVAGRDGKATMTVDARFVLQVDASAERLAMAALNLNSVLQIAGNPRPLRWSVAAPHIDFDFAAQLLSAPDLACNVAGANLSVTVEGTHIIDDPHFAGNVTLAPLVLREYLPRLGLKPLPTRDPKAWSLVEASSRFIVEDHALRLEGLKATLDDSHVAGGLTLKNFAERAVDFDLTADRVDLDRYLAPAAQVSRQTEPTGAPVAEVLPQRAPVEANGTLAVGSLQVGLLNLSAVQLTVSTHDRIMHLFPVAARIDGGRYSGDITIDSRDPVPTLSLDEHLVGIDVGQLLNAESKSLRLSGRGSMNLKASGRGIGADAILRTLQGRFDASVADGALEGVDVGYEFGQASALLDEHASKDVTNTHRTPFNSFKLSAQIADGVASTHDLVVESLVLKLTGQGTVNLATQALDLALLADTKQSLANVPIQIPVKISGTISDPAVHADLASLAHGELKEKVKNALKDKLRSLFGNP